MICYSQARFLAKNGYSEELRFAKKKLKKDKVYTVRLIQIGDFHTSLTLRELPDFEFNSVMFEGLGKEI